MKRIHVIGLAIVAVFAFSAMGSSAAYAGTYGQCKLLTKSTVPKAKHGAFADPNCQELHAKKGKPDHKGNYEFFPGPSPSCVAQKHGEYNDAACAEKSAKAKKGKFERLPCYGGTGTGFGGVGNGCAESNGKTGLAKLSTAAGTIECAASTALGLITGPKSDKDRNFFTNCKAAGAGACQSVNPKGAAAEIVTKLLNTTLIDHGEKGLSGLEPKAGEAWVQFSAAEPPYLAEFNCAGVGFIRVTGSVSGTIAPLNVMALTATIVVAKGVAEQDLLTEICSDETCKTVLAKNLASTQEAEKASNTSTEETEIKA
jgi:hypothetical protein